MSSPPDRSVLLDRWCRLVGAGPRAEAAGRELLDRWAEPHRVYHTLAHLAAVLDRLDELAGDGVDVADPTRLAAWWHDAVYHPERKDNEAASARLAATSLTRLGLPAATVAETVRLVQVTAGHRAQPGDISAEGLCDADLAVLGSKPEAYLAYAAAVREEYHHLPDSEFAAGRAAVLRDLLGRPNLYATSAGRRRWAAAARANLTAELERAQPGGHPQRRRRNPA